jgi:ABC-type transport system involved in cytochrome bd biosynthesis fused ATPase/permease subunit
MTEAFLTIMLAFEIFYRMYMQSCRIYLEQKWNILDIIIVIFSILLLWVGIDIGGGVGEIDTVTAVLIIITRSLVMVFRLISSIKKKKDQEVQIIDLNDMSEMDDEVKEKGKNFRKFSNIKLEEHKIEYQESQVDI